MNKRKLFKLSSLSLCIVLCCNAHASYRGGLVDESEYQQKVAQLDFSKMESNELFVAVPMKGEGLGKQYYVWAKDFTFNQSYGKAYINLHLTSSDETRDAMYQYKKEHGLTYRWGNLMSKDDKDSICSLSQPMQKFFAMLKAQGARYQINRTDSGFNSLCNYRITYPSKYADAAITALNQEQAIHSNIQLRIPQQSLPKNVYLNAQSMIQKLKKDNLLTHSDHDQLDMYRIGKYQLYYYAALKMKRQDFNVSQLSSKIKFTAWKSFIGLFEEDHNAKDQMLIDLSDEHLYAELDIHSGQIRAPHTDDDTIFWKVKL